MQDPAGPSDPIVSPAWVSSGSETVLLVEDEFVVLRFAERSLRRLGFTVLACATSTEALAVAADHPGRIDILVTKVPAGAINGQVSGYLKP